MKLFTLHGGPVPNAEDSFALQIEASEELSKQLEPGWIQHLNEIICDDFVDVMEDHSEFKEGIPTKVIRITVRLDPEQNMFLEDDMFTYLESYLDTLTSEDQEKFKKIHKEFMDKLATDFGEYFEKVFSLNEKSGSE